MEALNIEAEYRKAFPERIPLDQESARLMEWANAKVKAGEWVLDDGDYYTRDEWYSQYEEPDTDCYCGHPECGAC